MSRIDDIRAEAADENTIGWLDAWYLLEVIDELSYVIDQLVEAGDDLLGYCGVPKHIEAWGRAKLAVCERTETAPTPSKPTRQADAK